MFSALDIQKALKILNLKGSSPNKEFLDKIVSEFSRLPYENITKILKYSRHPDTDQKMRLPDEVLECFNAFGTGGTCFSLVNTLYGILLGCGFKARIVMGDMKYGDDLHCALLVRLDRQTFLVDPGYLITRPVPLPPRGYIRIKTPINSLRIVHDPDKRRIYLFTENKGVEKWRYRLKIEPLSMERFKELWLRTFRFNMMESILITKVSEEGQLYLRNQSVQRVNRQQRIRSRVDQDYSGEVSRLFSLPSGLVDEAREFITHTERNDIIRP